MNYGGNSLVRADMALAPYRPLSVWHRSTRGTATAPKGHNMSAQGKQPRAPQEIVPCVVGSQHARPRLRSPGLRVAESAQSPERAQQRADQTNIDSQTRTICDQNECCTTWERGIDHAPLRVGKPPLRSVAIVAPFQGFWD
jgi:hypothetical protein